MKNKLIIIFGMILIVTFIYLGYSQILYKSQSQLIVKPIGDGRGIFVGQQRSQYKESNPTKWSPETRKRVEEYEADVKAIDNAWDNIGLGNSYAKAGDYERAALAYQKAYAEGKTQRHVSGFHLAETYERLGRYDDAIATLDNMIENRETNEYGIQQANEMKARLLAAKNQS